MIFVFDVSLELWVDEVWIIDFRSIGFLKILKDFMQLSSLFLLGLYMTSWNSKIWNFLKSLFWVTSAFYFLILFIHNFIEKYLNIQEIKTFIKIIFFIKINNEKIKTKIFLKIKFSSLTKGFKSIYLDPFPFFFFKIFLLYYIYVMQSKHHNVNRNMSLKTKWLSLKSYKHSLMKFAYEVKSRVG